MYTMTQGYKRKSYSVNIITTVTSLSLALFLLAASVKIVLASRFIYYFDIDKLNISEITKLDKAALKENYNVLIDYVQDNSISELKLPNFAMSNEGRIHFEEVKAIFNFIDYVFYITLVIAILGTILSLMKRKPGFLKFNSLLLILLPVGMAIPFAVDFDSTFTLFHNIAFNNDYWLFDPSKDPIITALPQAFFMHMAIAILLLVAIFSIISYVAYRLLNKKDRDSLF